MTARAKSVLSVGLLCVPDLVSLLRRTAVTGVLFATHRCPKSRIHVTRSGTTSVVLLLFCSFVLDAVKFRNGISIRTGCTVT